MRQDMILYWIIRTLVILVLTIIIMTIGLVIDALISGKAFFTKEWIEYYAVAFVVLWVVMIFYRRKK
jgi:hypothetical protein